MSDSRKNEPVKSQYDGLSADELSARLSMALFNAEDLSDAELEEVDEMAAAYQRKVSHEPVKSTEEAWEEFKTVYWDMDQDETVLPCTEQEKEDAHSVIRAASPHRRRLLRIGLIAAIVAVLLAVGTLTASAFGFNLWGWIARWDEDVAQFSLEEGEEVKPKTIPEALKYLGIDEPVYPKWLPEGFKRVESVIVIDEPIHLYEAYAKGELFLQIGIEPSSLFTESGNTQKDNSAPLEYISNNELHYILNDMNQYTAIWHTRSCFVRITGNVSLEELQAIIDSVY
jgi:hypothetical protein